MISPVSGFPVFVAGPALLAWRLFFFPAQPPRTRVRSMIAWLAFMFACAMALLAVLARASAPSVREDPDEIAFYLVFSFLFVAFGQWAFALLGVSVRDDVAERGNGAASFAAAGLTAGATCCAGGANIGDGPGPEVVGFCAGLAIAALLALWGLVALVSDAAYTITVERDRGAGIRVGGWLLGSGAVLGASIAGDWSSLAGTLRDFARCAWPLAPAACCFALIERFLRRRRKRPGAAASCVSAAAMAALGFKYAAWIGVGP